MPEVLVGLLAATLLAWLLARDSLPSRRCIEWALFALLLLVALVTLTAYVFQVVAWKRGAGSLLASLLILAVSGVVLWLAHRRK